MFEQEFDRLHGLAKKNDIELYDIYLSRMNAFSVKAFRQDVDTFNYSDSTGLGIRVVIGDFAGYSYTEKFDQDSLNEALMEAKINAENVDNKEPIVMKNYPSIEARLEIYNSNLTHISISDKIKKAKLLEKGALDKDKRIVNVPYALIGDNESFIKIANSQGLLKEFRSNICYAYASCLAKGNDQVKSASYEKMTRDFGLIDPIKISSGAADRALALLGARDISSGEYPIIFDNHMAATLLETFSSIFSAKNVQEGQSLLKGKIGEQIAHSGVSIIDDALLPEGFNTQPFDGEGYPSERTELISEGRLHSYLHNTITAQKDGTHSTGNASRSYSSTIDVSPTNMYFEPGNKTKQELYSIFPKAIEVVQLSGMHSGCNTISGDFSMGAQGFFCEDGERKHPLHNFTVSGNFFQLLVRIVELANDLKFNFSSFGAPAVLVEKLAISG